MTPKWQAYKSLKERLPEGRVCGARLCHNGEDIQRWWGDVAQDGIACMRTDTPHGGYNLPFLAFITLPEALSFWLEHQDKYLYMINEPVRCEVNGKAVCLDEDTVVVEWGYCETQRDFDAGKVAVEQVLVMGPHSHIVWGDTVFRCHSPTHCTNKQLDVLYRDLLASGLKETGWSLTNEHRLLFWG